MSTRWTPAGSVVVLASLMVLVLYGSAQSWLDSPVAGGGDESAAPPMVEGAQLGAVGRTDVEAFSSGFVANSGEAPPSIRYYTRGAGYSLSFTPTGVLLALQSAAPAMAGSGITSHGSGVVVGLRFVGASPGVVVEGRQPTGGVVNVLVGSDRSRWRTHVPSFSEVRYVDLWPGVDAVFSGRGGQLDYQFLVRPGADVSSIRVAYEGAERLSVDATGGVDIEAGSQHLRDAASTGVGVAGGEPLALLSHVEIGQGFGSPLVGLVPSAHFDRGRPMVVARGLDYSTYLGGFEFTEGRGITVDARGNAYVTGMSSLGFPTTPGAFDTSPAGGDVFVAKLNRGGTGLEYATFLGGDGNELGRGLAVDRRGSVYVTGETQSVDFPTTPGAHARRFGGGLSDAFVAKLDPTGSRLIYSTYVGGSGGDIGVAVAVDAQRLAYVSGATQSPDFPVTPGAFDSTYNGGVYDGFVAQLDNDGSRLRYGTFVGGSENDEARGVAVDQHRNAYVAGITGSSDFPTTRGAFDRTLGDHDVFVLKLDPTGAALGYSTYLGGTGVDLPAPQQTIAVDQHGNAFVTGTTLAFDFPTTRGAVGRRLQGPSDAFVTVLDRQGSTLVYSTLIGGTSFDDSQAITVDQRGSAYVTGVTLSSDYPTTPGAFDATINGGRDAFVTKLDPADTRLAYSTFLGGAQEDIETGDQGSGVAVDPRGAIYVIGDTDAADYPTTPGAIAATRRGFIDAFVTKLNP